METGPTSTSSGTSGAVVTMAGPKRSLPAELCRVDREIAEHERHLVRHAVVVAVSEAAGRCTRMADARLAAMEQRLLSLRMRRDRLLSGAETTAPAAPRTGSSPSARQAPYSARPQAVPCLPPADPYCAGAVGAGVAGAGSAGAAGVGAGAVTAGGGVAPPNQPLV